MSPATWPVGRGSDFVGTYEVASRDLRLAETLAQSDPRMIQLGEEIDLVRAALPEFEVEGFMAGHLTPTFFGSAIRATPVSPSR